MRKILVFVLSIGLVFSCAGLWAKDGSSKPSGSKPSYSKPSYSKPSGSKPSYSKPSGSKPSGSKPSGKSLDSHSKPSHSGFDSAAGKSKQREESQKKYVDTHPKYTNKSGKTVEVKKDSYSTHTARSLPPQKVQNHKTTIEHHYHHYYGARYDYYCHRPYVYVGGGYSSLFWWSMLDWDIHRQALWYYNHEQQFNNGELNRDLYNEQLKNEKLRNEIEKLRLQKLKQDQNYVDSEFKDDPEAMLDPDFVQAANREKPNGSPLLWMFGILGALTLLGVGIWLVVFKINWTVTSGG